MNKLNYKHRLLMAIIIGGGMAFSACTNEDYDFDKIDYTLGFGSGELTLPSNNSFIVELDDILDLGSTDLITTDANGDYRFGKDPESVNSVKVKVDAINLSADNSENFEFKFDLPNEVMILPPMTVIDCSQLSENVQQMLTISKDIRKMDYQYDVPSEVSSLDYVAVGGEKGVSLKLNLGMPSLVTKSDITLDLPDILDIPEGVESGNILKLENLTGQKTIELFIKGIKMTGKPSSTEETDYAYLENGEFKMQGMINMTLKINELTKPSNPTVSVNANVTMGAIQITSAKGVFKPTINAMQVGSTAINSLPDFLTDSRVVADIDNPQIWLDITSNLPLGGIVDARLSSSTLNGYVELSKANGNPLIINANGPTKLVVCRKAPDQPNGYTPVIAPNLSDIVKKLSEGMTIAIDVTKFEATQNGSVTVLLDHDYEFTPAYRFTAPLTLGDDALIIYSDKENDMNKDLEDIQLQSGSKILLTADVNNGIPADLEINITPIDKNGNNLSQLTVNPIQNKVKAGTATTEIKYEIVDTNGKGLKEMDGVKYELKVTAPFDNNKNALNKKQKIKLEKVTLHLNGKIVYDAN